MAQRKFAVFDIDGTLIRWQLYHAVVDELARAGHIDAEQFKAVRAARMNWKQRAHEAAFTDYERSLVELYNAAITEISLANFMAAVRAAFDEYKDQTYTYTRNLVQSLKAEGYLLLAISASQEQIVELLANYYGFDEFGGTSYEVDGNRFTGRKQPLRRERKAELLSQLMQKHGVGRAGSIGIGDSDSDIPLLELVERPIAFNPNKTLFQHARTQGWRVVIERKNMIYELEPKDGGYVLAQSNG